VTRIVADYQTSQLKKLVDAPEARPLIDSISRLIGAKNLDLLQIFLPNLSGQSFLALTHFDSAHPAQVGLIGGFKPKPGTENFDQFIVRLKAAYPAVLSQGTTGAGQVDGLDYQWIQGPGASDKICVARHRGWIVTAWGEASLRDWWERMKKKAVTPGLSQNPDYQKSLARIGPDSEAVLYLDYPALLGLLEKNMSAAQPATARYLATKLKSLGAAAVGTRFERGQIADRFSMLVPRQAQIDLGMPAGPCPFDTLNFTGPDTRFYWASEMNFEHAWKNCQEQAAQLPASNPVMSNWVTSLQSWAQSHNLDLEKNIIGPLGHEISAQVEWSADNTYPEAGLFIKLDRPDDFKPTEAAIIDTVRQTYVTSAAVNEIESGSQHFATLKFIQSLPVSPTITEDGPYFGLFLTENQAVRAFQRDASIGVLNNPDFINQLGDRWRGASQLVFLDSPRLLERSYQTALPYVSLAAMFNRTLSALFQGHTLPSDLPWLAPIGAWSFTVSRDDEGLKGYSISGIGNQGIFLAGGLGGVVGAWRTMGHPAVPSLGAPPFPAVAPPSGAGPSPAPTNTPAMTPPDLTNAATPSVPEETTNSSSPPAAPASTNASSPATGP
jgi:hypothetical protein